MTTKIQSWKNPDAVETTQNPVSATNATVMANIVGGRQQQVYSEDYTDPKFAELVKALSNLRFIF